MNKIHVGRSLSILLALLLCAPAALHAQTTAGADVREFEVITVDENHLVVRDQHGTFEYTVPPDFRFTVDGKSVTVADLKPGMKGTATIDKTTTVRPVHVSDVTMGTVVSQTGRSVSVKAEDGRIHRFTQSEADERGVRIYMDGKPVRIFNLNPGDRITATVVSTAAPELLTAADVNAAMTQAGDAAESAVAATMAVAEDATAAAEQAARRAEAEVEDVAESAEALDEEPNRLWLWILVLAIVVALAIWLLARKPPEKTAAK